MKSGKHEEVGIDLVAVTGKIRFLCVRDAVLAHPDNKLSGPPEH